MSATRCASCVCGWTSYKSDPASRATSPCSRSCSASSRPLRRGWRPCSTWHTILIIYGRRGACGRSRLPIHSSVATTATGRRCVFAKPGDSLGGDVDARVKPVWLPINYLVLQALHEVRGDHTARISTEHGSGHHRTFRRMRARLDPMHSAPRPSTQTCAAISLAMSSACAADGAIPSYCAGVPD
jgi:hypothetical protein